MAGQADDLCAELLLEWQFRREMVNIYSRSLIRLALDGNGTSQREARRELNEKLAIALLSLRHASDQLQACEREQVLARAMY